MSRGDDASTRPDAGEVGPGRGCGRTVDLGSVGIGGAGMTQLKGLRTSTSLECLPQLTLGLAIEAHVTFDPPL